MYQESMDRTLAKLPDGIKASGGCWRDRSSTRWPTFTLGKATSWSRVTSLRPVRRVLLGGISAQVVQHARIPVVIVPRG